jgi:hypothetical protein
MAEEDERAVSPETLDKAAAEAIAACGGDPAAAVRALIAMNAYLEAELERLGDLVSRGFARGRLR